MLEQEWTEANRQLLDEWRRLLAAAGPLSPSSSDETTLYSLFNDLTDDILCLFETGRGCVYLSPGWERLTGHACADSLRDAFYQRLQPECVKPFIGVLQQAVSDGLAQTELYPFRFRLMRADGTCVAHELHLGGLRRMENGQHQLVCRLKNVQVQEELREQLRHTRLEADRALRARSEFLNAMSHELRTPLNAILGFTQIMESGMYGEIGNLQYQEYLRHIRESSYELLAQIDDVMDIASIDSGTAQVRREKMDLAELLTLSVTLHRSLALEAQVAIACNVRPGYAQVRVDGVKMQHCVSHILANAVRHCRPGGRVAVEAVFNDNNELCITVTDDGIGMSARKLQTLVAALQRSDSWSTRNVGGLGLGLPLAKEFARLHGGYLTLDSKAGVGTRVTVHLPGDCVTTEAESGAKVLAYRAVAG